MTNGHLWTDAAVLAHAQAALRQGSKSFAAAARLLPAPARDSAVMLYAWCRHCDDVIDGQDLGHGLAPLAGDAAELALQSLQDETRAAFGHGRLTHPAFAALRLVARQHALPMSQPMAHLEGFRMDAVGQRYETLDDTLQYCYHVAGVVGIMMARIMGVRDAAVLARACDLGIGFQLTNIARDVIEDAEGGRVYLPAQWLAEAGVPAEAADVADPAHRAAVHRLAVRLLDVAEGYYASADTGIAALPGRCALAIATARRVYHAIGTAVRARGAAAWDTRVSTTSAQKLGHVAGAGWLAWAVRHRAPAPRPPAPWEARAGL
ncbi:phytoene/squalene synthase family protein [Achromobacter sp. GG226]|uniref:phytoene/squalene synthase family protein n=1 Tax=Verticiella alkaliphila TaxID=2779529 RepID=UPI001C0E1CF5|nr:phytoene/squalene synthase family protein [Verticiella sp. GG226]MBU4612790.1 phytoene/squalene synthase family protein [Verticiella sp. GG226]